MTCNSLDNPTIRIVTWSYRMVYKVGHPFYSRSGNKLQKADGTLDDNHQPRSCLFDDGTGMVRLLRLLLTEAQTKIHPPQMTYRWKVSMFE